MSSQRLMKLASRLAFYSKILYILTIISIFLRSVSLLWLTLMPNKFIRFFSKVRIYEPFVTDIDNTKISLYELTVGIIAAIFLFLILRRIELIFNAFSINLDIFGAGEAIKTVSLYFFAQSIILPFIKFISHVIFIKERLHSPLFEPSLFVLAGLLWYIGRTLQTKSVEKGE